MTENLIRGDRAKRTLHYYRVVVMGDSEHEPCATVARDLLADLRHHLGAAEWERAVEAARTHHEAEVASCN